MRLATSATAPSRNALPRNDIETMGSPWRIGSWQRLHAPSDSAERRGLLSIRPTPRFRGIGVGGLLGGRFGSSIRRLLLPESLAGLRITYAASGPSNDRRVSRGGGFERGFLRAVLLRTSAFSLDFFDREGLRVATLGYPVLRRPPVPEPVRRQVHEFPATGRSLERRRKVVARHHHSCDRFADVSHVTVQIPSMVCDDLRGDSGRNSCGRVPVIEVPRDPFNGRVRLRIRRCNYRVWPAVHWRRQVARNRSCNSSDPTR